MKAFTLFICSLLILSSCNESVADNNTFIPEAPDYSNIEMWTSSLCGTDVDVFYILPTCVFDWKDNETECISHHYDPNGAYMKDNFDYSLKLAEEIFAENCNFYSPYYRQISLESWIESEDVIEERFSVSLKDIENAFDYFIKNYNEGHKIVIAGYSQGAKAALELLKRLDKDVFERVVATYIIGYKVTAEDLKNCNVVPAEGEYDKGRVICYNSVNTPNDIWPQVTSGSVACINPVSWSTYDDIAFLDSAITVRIDTAYNVLIVEGYDNVGLSIPALEDVVSAGNYHLSELTLYKDQLRDNVRKRIN